MKLILLAVCLVVLQFRSHAAGKRQTGTGDESVVLLHGLGRTPLSMKYLEWGLKRAGYLVVNVGYPSRGFAIEILTEDCLKQKLDERIPANAGTVHFVTHSLGGVLLRQYLSRHATENIGRVVMLAPPNQGSAIVDRLRRTAFGRWILGPAGCQLGTRVDDLPKRLGAVNFETGVIAGDRSFNPCLASMLTGANDGKVSLASARVEGMKDFAVVRSSHTWMMWRREVVWQCVAFLRNGHFDHAR